MRFLLTQPCPLLGSNPQQSWLIKLSEYSEESLKFCLFSMCFWFFPNWIYISSQYFRLQKTTVWETFCLTWSCWAICPKSITICLSSTWVDYFPSTFFACNTSKWYSRLCFYLHLYLFIYDKQSIKRLLLPGAGRWGDWAIPEVIQTSISTQRSFGK